MEDQNLYQEETYKIIGACYEVFNTLGERVGVLASEELSAGTYNYKWDASNLTSGIYFYILQAGDFIQTKKMILLK